MQKQLSEKSNFTGERERAQATLEFSFAMIVVVLLLMGMIQVMVWTGRDLVDRRQEHERTLTTWAFGEDQTDPTFYFSTPIGASVESNIFEDRDF